MGIARAAAKLGYQTEFYTKSLGPSSENFDLEYYRREFDGVVSSEEKLSRLKAESYDLGVRMLEEHLDLNGLLSKISEDCLSIVLLDWNRILDKKGYQGHFVPIVGYDERNVYVHNHGEIGSEAFMVIERNLFDCARMADGTDEDVVFIYRKKL